MDQPYLDIYRGIEMSIAGILAWRSVLEDSKTYDVPDFRKEDDRNKFDNDHYSPSPDTPEEFKLPSSILGDIKPTNEGLTQACKHWTEVGFKE